MRDIVDELDKKILAQLIENGRIPVKQLSRKLDVHSNTLLQRIKKLEEKGIIKKYSALVNFSKCGYDLHVIIMMKVKRGHAGDPDQVKDLLQIQGIEALYATTGIYDLFCLCRVKNRHELLELIQNVGENPIVTKSATQIILFPYKSQAEFNPFLQ